MAVIANKRLGSSMLVLAMAASACTSSVAGRTASGQIRVVAAENQYGDVAQQIGGAFVSVTSIESNPDVDPHAYEVSASVAKSISTASIVIQNGLGYDPFMNDIENAGSVSGRSVIVVQKVLGLPDSTPNPHLWYDPKTMPALAEALTAVLDRIDPAHASYFDSNETRFVASLAPWREAIARFAQDHPGVPVATTEPVADYLLQALGTNDLTPFSLEVDVMNGVDPAPQDVVRESDILAKRRVAVLVYNQQVTDSVTAGFIAQARHDGVPVVGVYETMPSPGYDYQTWMEAEVRAIDRAVTSRASTQQL
jgi:zinc/manganese transport system substrate-binding protein